MPRVHSDFDYSKGIHTFKAGVLYEQTFLRENDSLGVVDPTYPLSAPCVDVNGNPLPGYSDPIGLRRRRGAPESQLPPSSGALRPYPRRSLYNYFGHTDVKELALYIEDQIKAGNWLFNLGMRGDIYNGLTSAQQAEPRVGIAIPHQAHQHGAERLLCAHPGDAVQ